MRAICEMRIFCIIFSIGYAVRAFSSRVLRSFDVIGLPQVLLTYKDGYIALTKGNLITWQSVADGDSHWKVQFETSEVVHDTVLGDEKLYILSTTQTGRRVTGMIRTIQANSGILLWDTEIALSFGAVPLSALTEKKVICDMIYSEERHSLVVLFNNEILTFQVVNGHESPNKLQIESAAQYRLLSLFKAKDGRILAGGCMVQKGLQDKCRTTFYLDTDISDTTSIIQNIGSFTVDISAYEVSFSGYALDGSCGVSALHWRKGEENDHSIKVHFTMVSSCQASPYSLETFLSYERNDYVQLSPIHVLNESPAALLCVGHFSCLTLRLSNKLKHLSITVDTSTSPLCTPILIRSPWHSKTMTDLSFLRITTHAQDIPNSGEIFLIVEEGMISFLSQTTAYMVTSDLLLLSDGQGLLSALQVKDRKVFLSKDVIWVRFEGLTEIKHGFFLSGSHVKVSIPQPGKRSFSDTVFFDSVLPSFKTQRHPHIVAVFVTHRSLSEQAPLAWNSLGLRVYGIQAAQNFENSFDWMTELQVNNEGENILVRKITAVKTMGKTSTVWIVADTVSHGLFFWTIDSNGQVFPYAKDSPSKSYNLGQVKVSRGLATANVREMGALRQVFSGSDSSLHVITQSTEGEIYRLNFNGALSNQCTRNECINHPGFFHLIDKEKATVEFFRSSVACERMIDLFACHKTVSITGISLTSDDETKSEIYSVAYASPEDRFQNSAVSLSDDNLLKKYLSPNLMLLCASRNNQSMAVYALDAVSGKVIKRFLVDQVEGPVDSVLVENHLVVSYWNPLAKRAELFVAALYESFIGKHDLVPGWKMLPRLLGLEEAQPKEQRSSFDSPQIISMEKIYVLPRKIMSIKHTMSLQGVSGRNLVVAMDSGEVFSLDLRGVHPRRPVSEPTPAEKEEGLQRYNPFAALPPILSVTGNASMSGSGELVAVVSPSLLESSCLLLLFGREGSRGLRILHHVPGQSFDTLAEDFNQPLLLLLLSALAGGVFLLRYLHMRSTINKLWM